MTLRERIKTGSFSDWACLAIALWPVLAIVIIFIASFFCGGDCE